MEIGKNHNENQIAYITGIVKMYMLLRQLVLEVEVEV